MANPVPPDEVNHQKHQQRSANHHSNSDLKAELEVVEVRDSAKQVRPPTSEKLRDKHVYSDRSGMCATRHHVVNHCGDGAVIPRHKETGDRHSRKNYPLLVRLNGNEQKWCCDQERHANSQQTSVVETL